MIAKGSNALSPTGKVHSVTRKGNSHFLVCNSWFNLAIDGWPDWKQTYNEVTCRNCLKLRKEANKIWRIRYRSTVAMKEKYLVAPNRTEAVLLFGRNMPSDCCDPQVKEELVSIDEFLKEKRML